jgi:hypothetical protein
MTFGDDCADYYDQPLLVAWDFDGNGSYEVPGDAVPFDATALDGPDTAELAVRVLQPLDGRNSRASTRISILNAPPTILSAVLRDPAGHAIGSDVPFALVGLRLTLDGRFRDPGRPDTHTARVVWGDGQATPHGSLEQFQDSTGGVTGTVVASHRYAESGIFEVELGVLDDDGDDDAARRMLRVLAPAEVIEEVIEALDVELAAATDPAVVEALLEARAHLAGDDLGQGNNGALSRLQSGTFQAAMTQLLEAVEALVRVGEAGGPDTQALRQLLGLAANAVARQRYDAALTANSDPTASTSAALARSATAIDAGIAALAVERHVEAVERFREAVQRAESVSDDS